MPDNYTKERAVIEYIILLLQDDSSWSYPELEQDAARGYHRIVHTDQPISITFSQFLGMRNVYVYVNDNMLPKVDPILAQAVIELVERKRQQANIRAASRKVEKEASEFSSAWDALLGNKSE